MNKMASQPIRSTGGIGRRVSQQTQCQLCHIVVIIVPARMPHLLGNRCQPYYRIGTDKCVREPLVQCHVIERHSPCFTGEICGWNDEPSCHGESSGCDDDDPRPYRTWRRRPSVPRSTPPMRRSPYSCSPPLASQQMPPQPYCVPFRALQSSAFTFSPEITEGRGAAS